MRADFPPGNYQGKFPQNVLPLGAAAKPRPPTPPPPKIGTFTVSAWTADLDAAFSGCPFQPKFEKQIRDAFRRGATVTVARQKTAMKVTIKNPNGGGSSMSGSWG